MARSTIALPVMVARNADGSPIVVWANYACHCTTVGSRNQVGGDWAGHANEEIEKRLPFGHRADDDRFAGPISGRSLAVIWPWPNSTGRRWVGK